MTDRSCTSFAEGISSDRIGMKGFINGIHEKLGSDDEFNKRGLLLPMYPFTGSPENNLSFGPEKKPINK